MMANRLGGAMMGGSPGAPPANFLPSSDSAALRMVSNRSANSWADVFPGLEARNFWSGGSALSFFKTLDVPVINSAWTFALPKTHTSPDLAWLETASVRTALPFAWGRKYRVFDTMGLSSA